jgi:hypothetical protein
VPGLFLKPKSDLELIIYATSVFGAGRFNSGKSGVLPVAYRCSGGTYPAIVVPSYLIACLRGSFFLSTNAGMKPVLGLNSSSIIFQFSSAFVFSFEIFCIHL